MDAEEASIPGVTFLSMIGPDCFSPSPQDSHTAASC